MTHWLSLVTILLVAIFLRFWHITTTPPGFYFDEAYEGLEAWYILTKPAYHPIFLTGNSGVPVLNAYANAFMFGLFRFFGSEVGPVTMHVTAACLGVLGVYALYGLAHELQKIEASDIRLSIAFPLFAAASLAVMRWHIHFSRMGIEPIFVPLLWAGATWLFLRGWRTGHWPAFAGSGVLLAACMYAYQAAWLIPLLMIPVTLVLLWQKVKWPANSLPTEQWQALTDALRSRQGFGMLVTVSIASLLFAPLTWFFWQHLDQFSLRLSQVTAIENANTDLNVSVWQTSWATVKMYSLWGLTGDLNMRRNLPGAPVMSLWQILPFYLGLGLAVWRVRHPGYTIILISLVGLLLAGALSSHAPHFHRTLGAAAPSALLCAIGLDYLWQWRPKLHQRRHLPSLSRWWSVMARQVGWVSILLIALGGVTSARDYFGRWATEPELFNTFRVGLWQVSQQVAELPPTVPVYMTLSDYDYPILDFALQTHQNSVPVLFDGRHIFPMTAQSTMQPQLYIVIEGENRRTAQLLTEFFPTATVQKEVRDWQGHLYARYYVRPTQSVPQHLPQHPVMVTLGDGITLLGYDLRTTSVQPGKNLYLQLQWQVASVPTTDWTVCISVMNKDVAGKPGVLVRYADRPGKGSLPTNHWQKGWRIWDEYKIKIPANLASGDYGLTISLVQTNGQHLPLTGDGVSLGKVKIK